MIPCIMFILLKKIPHACIQPHSHIYIYTEMNSLLCKVEHIFQNSLSFYFSTLKGEQLYLFCIMDNVLEIYRI